MTDDKELAQIKPEIREKKVIAAKKQIRKSKTVRVPRVSSALNDLKGILSRL